MLHPAKYTFVLIKGCPLENFPSGLVDHINMLVQARLTIANADVSFATNVLCSTDPKPVIFFSNAASSQICKLTELFQDIRLYFGCDNWFPLYEQSVYTAMCYSGTDGFAWVTSTQCVIVFMSMIILTFRVAFYDIEIEGAKEEMKLVENDESQNEDSDKDGDDGRNEEDSEK